MAACRAWRSPVTVVTRLRLDAALYVPAPPRRPGQTGRPRRKGARQPTLAVVAADPDAAWIALTVAHRYGAGAVVRQATWYHKREATFADALALVRRDIAKQEEESMTNYDYYRRLTKEEERELMDPSFWEAATSEVFPGNPDARLGFHVSLDRRHARMLAEAAPTDYESRAKSA